MTPRMLEHRMKVMEILGTSVFSLGDSLPYHNDGCKRFLRKMGTRVSNVKASHSRWMKYQHLLNKIKLTPVSETVLWRSKGSAEVVSAHCGRFTLSIQRFFHQSAGTFRGQVGHSYQGRNPGPDTNWTQVVKHILKFKGKTPEKLGILSDS